MNRKNVTVFAATALVVLLVAATAMANPYGQGRHGGKGVNPGFSQLTPEKQAAFASIMNEYQDKVFPIRQDIWAKNTELNALYGNPNADPKRITTLVNDIKNLHTGLYEMRKSYGQRIEKEIGINVFNGGPGFGNCPGGNGGYSRGGPGFGDCPGGMGGGMGGGRGGCGGGRF